MQCSRISLYNAINFSLHPTSLHWFLWVFLALSEMKPRDVPLVPLHIQCTWNLWWMYNHNYSFIRQQLFYMISTDCAINAMEAITDMELQICVFYFSDPFVWYLTLKNMTYDKITHRVTANISWTVPFNTSHIKNYAVAWEVVNNDSNNRNSAGYENHITTQMYHVISLAPNKEYQVSVCKDLYPVPILWVYQYIHWIPIFMDFIVSNVQWSAITNW